MKDCAMGLDETGCVWYGGWCDGFLCGSPHERCIPLSQVGGLKNLHVFSRVLALLNHLETPSVASWLRYCNTFKKRFASPLHSDDIPWRVSDEKLWDESPTSRHFALTFAYASITHFVMQRRMAA